MSSMKETSLGAYFSRLWKGNERQPLSNLKSLCSHTICYRINLKYFKRVFYVIESNYNYNIQGTSH